MTVNPDCVCRLHALCGCVCVCVRVCLTCLTLICAAWEIAWASPRTEQREHRKKTGHQEMPKTGRQETPNGTTPELYTSVYIFLHPIFTSASASNGTQHRHPTQSRSPPIVIQGAAFEGRNPKVETNIDMTNMCLIARIAMAVLN